MATLETEIGEYATKEEAYSVKYELESYEQTAPDDRKVCFRVEERP